MKKSNLKLYSLSDIERTPELIIHTNAFIRPDGGFYLAKGHTGNNPSKQLESSALMVAREDIAYDINAIYVAGLKKLVENGKSPIIFSRLRNVLVHYFGYALFARVEFIRTGNVECRFTDESLVPNPRYYGKEITLKQQETLGKLFELNDDETLVSTRYFANSEEIFAKVLDHRYNSFHEQ